MYSFLGLKTLNSYYQKKFHLALSKILRSGIFILGKERGIRGSKYGSSNPHVEFPMLIELYLAGKLDLDSLVTGNYRINQSNEAFEVLAKGGAGRGLITFD
jgi:Zn-dependent alcohol dehydrogenase